MSLWFPLKEWFPFLLSICIKMAKVATSVVTLELYIGIMRLAFIFLRHFQLNHASIFLRIHYIRSPNEILRNMEGSKQSVS